MKDRSVEFRQQSSSISILDSHDVLDWNDGSRESIVLLPIDDWDNTEKFLEDVGIVHKILEEIENLLERIKVRHSQILVETGIHKELSDEVGQITDLFKQKSKTIQAAIKRLNGEIVSGNSENKANLAAERIRQNQLLALSKKFQNILMEFNNEQLKYKEKCKQKITSFLKISGIALPEEDVDDAIDSGKLFDYTKELMLAQREKKELYDEAKLRHVDIRKIESSILELHELFQDLALLIENQGEMLNNIETNVASALDYAERAQKNVKEARKKQASLRKMKIIIFIVLVILIILLFVIGSTVFCFYLPFFCSK